MTDWFRNTQWNDDIAATFEARLGRARDKAQYLNLQGYALLATRPDAAAQLFERAIALDEPDQIARAALYLATALACMGDFDGAIAALETAIDAEARHPRHRTAARLDQALLVALAKRDDLYDLVLRRLESETVLAFDDQSLSALIAQTLIRGERSEDVADMADAALAALGKTEERCDDLPEYLSPDLLRGRLKALAAN